MNHALVDILRLIRSPQVGPVTYQQLCREHGSATEAIKFLQRKNQEIISEKEALAEIKQTEALGGRIIAHTDPCYPKLLLETPDYPPVLSLLGNAEILAKPMIAVVGSRAASLAATKFTHKLVRDLADAGFIVISGLARGIDGAAHKGCLPHPTIAAVAGGVDVLYPPEHKKLREEIIQHGAVISEMPLGLFPGAKHFPRRNRLISGLSVAVCVIEAAKPSGTLITAGYALDQNKELFAVPGFPGDARSAGTNYLLRTGAHVLESIQDIFNVLGTPAVIEARQKEHSVKELKVQESAKSYDYFSSSESLDGKDSSKIQNEILMSLSSTPVSVETLLQELDHPEKIIYDALTHLELQDHIIRDRNGYVFLAR